MALRWRLNGEVLCAAKSEAEEHDTYIDDRLHYELSTIQKTIVPALDEEETGRWFWLHGWCNTSEHLQDVPDGVFTRAERYPRKENVEPLTDT